jgi:hypothetical protein
MYYAKIKNVFVTAYRRFRYGKWHVSIRSNGKNIYLGVFADLEVAKNARIHAEIKMFGQYRRCDIAKS